MCPTWLSWTWRLKSIRKLQARNLIIIVQCEWNHSLDFTPFWASSSTSSTTYWKDKEPPVPLLHFQALRLSLQRVSKQQRVDMAALTALPNELLLLVFTSCPSISAAVRLSEVNKSLRSVWLENIDHIAREVLKPEIPDFDDALALAKYECGEGATISQYLPQLLRNAEWAQNIATGWAVYVQRGAPHVQEKSKSLTSIYKSYYMLRQLVNSYTDMKLQRALSAVIDAESTAEATTHFRLCYFMCNSMDNDESLRQGMQKDESLWTEDERLDGSANRDEWEFAMSVVMVAMREKRFSYIPGYASPDPCPWTFGSVCCDKDCRRGEER